MDQQARLIGFEEDAMEPAEGIDSPGEGLKALIPLDGTNLSESAFALLPVLRTLGLDRVTLVSVWEQAWSEEQIAHPNVEVAELAERGRAHLSAYLTRQAEGLEACEFEVRAKVRIGRPAEATVKAATEENADLIVIATHGRDSLARWRLGSVADKIVRQADCPTLVIGPNVNIRLAPYTLRRILVPLDGSALAEEALSVATRIAETTGAELDLVRVEPLPALDAAIGTYPTDYFATIQDAARTYLDGKARCIEGRVAVTTALLTGPAPERLLGYATDHAPDLVIVASHGRAGIARAVLGSVTDRLVHGPAPVLVLRPEEVKSGLIQVAKTYTRRSHIHRLRARQLSA